MATILNQEDEDENKVKLEQPGGQQLSSASGLGSGQASNSQATKTGTGPTRTGFVNLSRYVDANKEGTTNMTGQLVDNIEDKRSTAETGLNTSFNNFKTASGNQNLEANQEMLGKLAGDGNLNELAGNSDMQRMQNAQYTGPRKMDQGYINSLDKASSYAENSQSHNGRKELLRDQYDNGRYTRGLSGLDSALIGTDEGATERFGNIRNKVEELRGVESGLNKRVEGIVNYNDDQAWQTRNDYNSALRKRMGSLDQVAAQQAAEYNTTADKLYNAKANSSDEGVSLGDYITKNEAFTGDDFKGRNREQYEALRRLGANVGDISDGHQVGDAYWSTDHDGYKAAVAKAKKKRLEEEELRKSGGGSGGGSGSWINTAPAATINKISKGPKW